MQTAPLVSVIIPAYNAERYIRQTISSVLAQTYSRIEVIVVDDGSTDGTADQVRAFGNRVRYVRQENSGGAARPRNTACGIAAGDLLTFLDADDVMGPDRLAREVEFLRDRPDVALVFTNYRDFTETGAGEIDHFLSCPLLSARLSTGSEGATTIILDPPESTELLLTENFGHSSPTVRRDIVISVGGYDESAVPSEDFEFQYRVAAHHRIGLIPQVDWYKREHRESLSANTPRVLLCKIAIRRRMLDREVIARRRRKLKRMLARYHLGLAYYYTGRQNGLALRHVLAGAKLWPRPHARLLLRILLDVLGRDTNRVVPAPARLSAKLPGAG